MTRRRTAILLALGLVLGFAFVAAAQESPPTAQELLKQAQAHITEVTPDQVKAAMDKGEGAVILDVREPEEYEAGHLPGAILIPLEVLKSKIRKQVPDTSTTVYAYCRGGGRSAMATWRLQRLGFTNVSSMAGGYLAWVEAGYPVER